LALRSGRRHRPNNYRVQYLISVAIAQPDIGKLQCGGYAVRGKRVLVVRERDLGRVVGRWPGVYRGCEGIIQQLHGSKQLDPQLQYRTRIWWTDHATIEIQRVGLPYCGGNRAGEYVALEITAGAEDCSSFSGCGTFRRSISDMPRAANAPTGHRTYGVEWRRLEVAVDDLNG